MLGDHRLDLRRIGQREALEGIVRGAVVGHEIEVALPAVDRGVVVGKAGEQRAELLLRALPVEDLGARGTLRGDDEEPLAILRRPRPEITQRMGLVLIDEAVVRLLRAECMVVDLLELVLRRVDTLLRGVVGTVVEAFRIGRPRGPRVFHPVDAVFGQGLGLGIHDADLDPVRTRCRRGIGKIAAVLGERRCGQCHRTVLGEGVRVEEDLAGLTGLLRAVEHRLVLQTVVIIVVIPVAVFGRSPLLGVVPQLGQPLADGVAEGDLREVVVGHGIFGSDPGGRCLRVVVLEPAVGIRHLGAEIVVHHLAAGRLGVGKMLDLLHVVATGRCQGRRSHQQRRLERVRLLHKRKRLSDMGAKLGKIRDFP